MTDAIVAVRPPQDRLSARLARSAESDGEVQDVIDWLHERRASGRFTAERIAFADLEGWSFDETSGNLRHRTRRFFTVEGMRATVTGPGVRREWHQPVINQPETGILGILAKEFDGVLHFLVQAKMEPGNPGLVQLSPTVQATRSNYTRAHGGGTVRYLDFFTRPGRTERVLADGLQSEHGSWFWRKFNRNMVVETASEVPLHEDFRWLTLHQLGRLLRQDHTVNMDTRTVLSCLPLTSPADDTLYTDGESLSWIAAERSRQRVRAELLPLTGLPGWAAGPWSIEHEQGRYFRVVAVAAGADNREVTRWTQPMIEPLGTGVAAFLTRTNGKQTELLVQARAEGGLLDQVELAPTVQCTPAHHAHLPGGERPPFLDEVLSASAERVHYGATHSEEGGRFFRSQARYLLVEADEHQARLRPPSGFSWIPVGRLNALVRHGHHVNVQARSLLACLHALAAPR
ncbi:NDP-hexose 2,3-dehydratase family protein [Streptomyces sp. CA2R101]|uniref:NDP-hexose 2,3-dehydratase family protein n=1 Tax=Streptomyces sp. CA2R101 TaxID=3120152 RepID=UPI003009826F